MIFLILFKEFSFLFVNLLLFFILTVLLIIFCWVFFMVVISLKFLYLYETGLLKTIITHSLRPFSPA